MLWKHGGTLILRRLCALFSEHFSDLGRDEPFQFLWSTEELGQ
jgi:hypothetical protein